MRSLVAFITASFLAFQYHGECATSPYVGINYGQIASNLPSPQKVVELIKSTTIRKLKLYDANPMILGAFGSSGVDFVVSVKNEEISSMLDTQVALKWVSENVALYMKTSPISAICVGNQVLTLSNSTIRTQLVMAMRNIYAALQDLKLSDRVAVSSPQSMEILSQSFPPSSGEFSKELVNPVLLPMLRFLNQTGCPFMMNIYPYFSYKEKPLDISLSYALFLPNNGMTDPNNKLHYENLFDAQLDAVYGAISRLGFTNIQVVVSETGWPSRGSPIELGTSVSNAMAYNTNLVKHIQSGAGTPMRPKQNTLVYIFALFNENLKQGTTSQKNFGLFRPDLSAIYDIGILQKGAQPQPSPPLIIPIPRPPPPSSSPPPLIIPIPRTPPPPKLVIPIPRSPPPSSPPGIRYPPPPSPPMTIPIPKSPPPTMYVPPPAKMCPPEQSPPAPAIRYPPPPSKPTYPPPIAVPLPPISYPPPATFYPPILVPPPTYYPPTLPPSTPSYPPPMTSYPPVPYVPAPPSPTTPGQGDGGTHIWCVAKPGGDLVALMAGLNYACGEGGADCSPIQPGGSCFSPDTLASHASYAFNSYYQKHGRNYWNCFFSGNALVTVSDPSSGSCIYPAQ